MRWWGTLHAAQLTLTYYVQVGGVGRSRVALHPGWGACLHVDEGGPKAVDVCFCGMAPAQNHLRAHVYLKKTRNASFACLSPLCPVLDAGSFASMVYATCPGFQRECYSSIPPAKENPNPFSRVRTIWKEPSLQDDKEHLCPWTEYTADLTAQV